MIHFRITHTTAYKYDEPASLSYNEARLLPRTFETPLFTQKRLAQEVVVEPFWRDARERQDSFGNDVLYFTMRQAHSDMKITVTSEVALTPKPPLFLSGSAWESVRATLLDSTTCPSSHELRNVERWISMLHLRSTSSV